MEKEGWEVPTDPDPLKFTRLCSVALRKEWNPKPYYWVEIYFRHFLIPHAHTQSVAMNVYHVYRQWSFYSSSEGKQIKGNTKHHPTSDLDVALSVLEDRVFRRKSRRDIMCYYDVSSSTVVAESQDLKMVDDRLKKLALDLQKPPPKVPVLGQITSQTEIKFPTQKDRKKTPVELFRESQRKREKDAKW